MKRRGFTLIEVMLVLGLTGLLLIGLLSGTFSSIARQRYNDSVRSFAEYLRTIYSEVISPESLGQGNSNKYAVLGKVLVVGYPYADSDDDTRSVFSATMIGDASLPVEADDFVGELADVNAQLYCGQRISGVDGVTTTARYEPLWQAELMQVNDSAKGLSSANRFTGTIIIARSPTSGAVHTIYTEQTYDLRDGCASATATYGSAHLHDDLVEAGTSATSLVKFLTEEVGFCVKSDQSTLMREVRLAADGRNTSAVSILNTDIQDDGTGGNRCNN